MMVVKLDLSLLEMDSQHKMVHQSGTIVQYTMPCSYKDGDWGGYCILHRGNTKSSHLWPSDSIALNLLQMNCNVNVSSQQAQKISSTNSLESMYCFEGRGKFAVTCKLTLKDDAQPIIHASQRARVQLHDKIQAELDRMVEWMSSNWSPNLLIGFSITYVVKVDGSLRVCIDPKDLNRAGCWSAVLDTDSQLLTTFSIPFGRYCFKRLPFGLNVSQDVFQAAMDRNLEGLKGVISIADDTAVVGQDQAHHDRNLHALMT